MKPYQKLEAFWRRTGCRTNAPPLTEAQVFAIELRYRIRIPEDFREYLRRGRRLEDPYWDKNATSWWGAGQIRSIPDEYEHAIRNPGIRRTADKCLFFADLAIWCWAWAIDCSNTSQRGKIVVIGTEDRVVADSFGAFVDLYIRNVRLVS